VESAKKLFKGLPASDELRQKLAANLKEREYLRSLLRLAEKRDSAAAHATKTEAGPCK
jgi:hypothetical protein